MCAIVMVMIMVLMIVVVVVVIVMAMVIVVVVMGIAVIVMVTSTMNLHTPRPRELGLTMEELPDSRLVSKSLMHRSEEHRLKIIRENNSTRFARTSTPLTSVFAI
jgi:hypothetical protein